MEKEIQIFLKNCLCLLHSAIACQSHCPSPNKIYTAIFRSFAEAKAVGLGPCENSQR